MNSVLLNGVKTYAFSSKDELIELVATEKKMLVAMNAHKILHATDETRSIINKNIGYPDGTGAVMALKSKQLPSIKIAGCELWLDIIKKFYQTKSFYLVGGKQEVIEAVVAQLKLEYPGINLLNFRNGYLKEAQEESELVADITNKKPDIVFVAMGSPKQEFLMYAMQQKHQAIYQGLGGSFDVYTGKIKRAPKFWLHLNMEWAYRWLKEPQLRTKRNLNLFTFYYKLKTNKF